MDEAPDNESITGPVPEPGYEHGRNQRNHQQRHERARRRIAPAKSGPARRRPASGQPQHQGVVEVCGQEARQRHVPAQPEIDDARRLERRVEVRRKLDAEKSPESERHVGIAGEVKIELQGEPDRRHPCQKEGRSPSGGRVFIDRRNQRRDVVGENPLLEQAEEQQCQPDGEILLVESAGCGRKLGHHFAIVDDRTGDELGKEQHERAIFPKRERLYPSGLHVDKEGDLLESDERDAERQNDVQQNEIGAEHIVDRAVDEVGVFEKAEEDDVEKDADEQHRA
jgi:hypothetical protein